MNEVILKGTINITSDIDVVYNFPLDGNNKIINLDEDGLLLEDDNNIIGGSCLLPPISAKIAESDGDEYNYEMLYKAHLLSTYQQQFIAALIAALYRGKNLLLFMPELGYTFTRDRLCLYLFQLYGIQMGILEFHEKAGIYPKVLCWYDTSSTPIWLNLIYEARVIGPYEYLINYPIDANLRSNPKIMNMLINDIRPYAKTMEEKMVIIIDLHKKLHKNPNIRIPIKTMIYME